MYNIYLDKWTHPESEKERKERNPLMADDYVLPDQFLLSYHLHPHHQHYRRRLLRVAIVG